MRPSMTLIVILLAWTAVTHAATILVPDDAPTIQEGMDLAAAGDTVQVACGTYIEHDIAMKSGVVLRGQPDQPECVVIDCHFTSSAIICGSVDETTVITGLTITMAFNSAIRLTHAPVRISHVRFVDNESYFGGGIASTSSDAVIEHCLFQDNMGYGDGAISASNSSLTIRDCDFITNRGHVDGPGAIWCRNSPCTITRCRFIDNLSDTFSGAIYAYDGSDLVITDCTFAGNSAPGYPGAIFFGRWQTTTQVITGCTFYGNEGASTILAGMADLSVSNCIIANNQAPAFAVTDSIPSLSCTDIHGNEGGDWTAPIAGQLGQDGNIDLDPLFCDPAAGDLGLDSSSPCAPDGAGDCGLMGAWPVACGDLTGAGDHADLPPRLTLSPCTPNPFNPTTSISYSLPTGGTVSLAVYDVAGRLVRVLVRGAWQQPGRYDVVWHGRDGAGHQVGSGVYLCRLEVDGQVQTQRMALVR